MSMGKEGRIRRLLADIKYEEADGVHTFHLCHCTTHNISNGYSARGSKCASCLREEIERIKNEV